MPGLEDMTVDQLLAHARRLEGDSVTLQRLARNPATREGLLRLVKADSPNMPIPELDAADKIATGIVKPLQDKLEALERSIMERDIKDRLERTRSTVAQRYNLNADDMLGVEKLMTHETDPIPTYDAAARVYTASRQSALPTRPFESPRYSMPEKDIWAKGIGNPAALDRIAMDEAYRAWGDLKTGKVAGLGAARGAPM